MPLPSLATIEQYAAHVDTPPGADQLVRLETLLLGASAKVRSRAGQQFTAGTTTRARMRIGSWGRVRPPQRPVTAVTEVLGPLVPDTGPNPDVPIAWQWAEGDEYITVGHQVFDTWAFEPYRRPLTEVFVTYAHGYDEIPVDIVEVVCNMAARALGVDPTKTGYTQQAAGPYSVTIGTTAAQGSLGLLPDERDIVDAYGYRPSAIVTRPRPIGGMW